MLVALDRDSNVMLNVKGIQLAYRHLETVQCADDDFRNREPKATTHYERFVASKVTLRGAISTLPLMGNLKFHRVRNMVERPHDLEKLIGTPAWEE